MPAIRTPYTARPAPTPRRAVGYSLGDLVDDFENATGLGPVALVALVAIAAGAVAGVFVSF